MKSYMCIKDVVLHVHDKTKEAFKGTKYKETYLFYHDALSTRTDKDCINWMKEESILD